MLTFDGRGNGKSDRPSDVDAYVEHEFAADALAVMDATATERAVVAGFSLRRALGARCSRPTTRSAFRAPSSSARPYHSLPPHPERTVYSSHEQLDTDEGWAKYNHYYWLEH